MTNRNITPADEANAKRLYALWQAKKMAMGLTQTSAAQKLGYKSQSMVSMQLKGEVALNTDAILKWAQLLGGKPRRYRPRTERVEFFSLHDATGQSGNRGQTVRRIVRCFRNRGDYDPNDKASLRDFR